MALLRGRIGDIVTKVLSDNTAQSVLKYLKDLESIRDHVRTRWIWELLQNARDASIGFNTELKICIERNNNELIFKHNGKPFSVEEIAHLIFHGSTKVEKDESIGQYGSGFLTTHLLSQIKISGRIIDRISFDFSLKREISSVSDLGKSMRDALTKFEDSLSKERHTNDDYTTNFRYSFQDDDVVDDGISSLKKCAPLILVFNQEFSSISIISRKTTSFKVTKRHQYEEPKFEIVEVLVTDRGNDVVREFLLANSDNASIAIPIESFENNWRCLPVHNTPRLFLGLPLIGTEDFSFPVVINSLKFTPTEQRDGVRLGKAKNQTNLDNQKIIEEAAGLLIELIKLVTSHNWNDVHLLGEFIPIRPRDWFEPDWLRNQLKTSLIPKIRSEPIISSRSGLISIENSIIPFTEGVGIESVEDLWDLLDEMSDYHKILPRRSESFGWSNTVASWANVMGCEVTDLAEVVDSSKLALQVEVKSGMTQNEQGEIAEWGKIANLQQFLREEIAVIDWLNRFFGFLMKRGFCDVIHDRWIVSDQSGCLDKLSNLHRDMDVSEELKEIASLLDWEIREELRDTHITALKEYPGAGDRSDDYVIEELVKRIKDRSDRNPNIQFANACVRLFSWIVTHERWPLLYGFPVFAQEYDGDNRRVIRLKLETEEDKDVLAPVSAWVDNLERFSNLFPDRHTLANEFFDSIPNLAVWERLAEFGFFRTSVVISKRYLVNTFLSDEHLFDNVNHEVAEHVTVTSVVFMTKDDVGIMARVRQSKPLSALFWEFITKWLVRHDSSGLECREALCICGNYHRYYPAQWLVPLQNNQWVPRGERRAERATAQSIANMFRTEEWDRSTLSDIGTFRFLEAVGVSRFDLMRRLFLPNDEIRTEVDIVFMEMLKATGGNVSRLSEARQYLTYLQEDPGLSAVVADRLDRVRRVRENQQLGDHVEDLVKESLECRGFTVRRTGIGSDFEIEYDSVARLKLEMSGRTWLVEVKAASSQGVRMTATQANTARGLRGFVWVRGLTGSGAAASKATLAPCVTRNCTAGFWASRRRGEWPTSN